MQILLYCCVNGVNVQLLVKQIVQFGQCCFYCYIEIIDDFCLGEGVVGGIVVYVYFFGYVLCQIDYYNIVLVGFCQYLNKFVILWGIVDVIGVEDQCFYWLVQKIMYYVGGDVGVNCYYVNWLWSDGVYDKIFVVLWCWWSIEMVNMDFGFQQWGKVW